MHKVIGRWLLSSAIAGVVLGVVPLSDGEKYAWAQGSPEVSLRADTDNVEMGEAITITLSVMNNAGSAQPTDPRIKQPPGWVVTGPMISTQTQMSIINGQVSQKVGFRATWQVVPTTIGTSEIGPASFKLSGREVTAGKLRIQVRKPSPGGPPPRKQRRRPVDPFGGILGPFFGFGDDDDDLTPPAPIPEPPPDSDSMTLPSALEPQAFLRAVVDKKSAVVGEQVTLQIYLYSVPRSYQVVDPHEPPAPDFFQHVISTGENEARPVNVGGARWMVQSVRKIAFFPLKSGALTIGPMTITMLGQGLRGSGIRGGIVRASNPITVQVSEPPAATRPAGYQIGDVGSFNLQAQVEPRKVEAGGSVAITATLRGTGIPPRALRLPERKGISWLDPEIREGIDAGDTTVSGFRTFTYLVKLSDAGKVDLGEISVSFWNPKLQEYQTAKARLGLVDVSLPASPTPSNPAPAIVDPFAVVEPARTELRAYSPQGVLLADRPWYWLMLFGAPISVVLFQGAAGAFHHLKQRRRAQEESPKTLALNALKEAQEAETKGDSREAAASIERALFIAVEGVVGVKLRALLSHEIKPALETAKLPIEQIEALIALLSDCEQARFLPSGDSSTHALSDRASSLLKDLLR